MKKILLLVLSMVVAISLAIPIATPVAANTSTMTYLGINSNLDPLSPLNNAMVRLAIYKALDRDSIATGQGGTKVVSIITPTIPNPAVNRTYDPVVAKNILTAAGYPNGFSTTLNYLSTNAPQAVIAAKVQLDLGAIGISVTINLLAPAIWQSRLLAKNMPFFLTGTPVDNTFAPYEALGRLLHSSSSQNFTGYNKPQFDTYFNLGQFGDAENYAFDPTPASLSLPIVPLFYLGTPYYTIRVQAVCPTNSPPALSGVQIDWTKTLPPPPPPLLPPQTGTLYTTGSVFSAGGIVTLTAPLTYNQGLKFYVCQEWWVGIPLSPPEITTSSRTVTFTPNADKVATARYQQITSLGNISTSEPTVNPVGTTHTVWVNIGIPVAGIKVNFQIDGPNSAASGFAYTDATGKATFTYTGNNNNMDDIWAYIDSNKSDGYDSGEPRSPNTIPKSWVENRITGGGNINSEQHGKWTFDVNLGVLPAGGVDGKFNITNQDTKVTYRLSEFIWLNFYGGETQSPPASNNTVRFRGSGSGSDGSTITLVVIIEDAGESSKSKDRIAVVQILPNPPNMPWIGDIAFPSPPPPTLVTIDGGNFQIHNVK